MNTVDPANSMNNLTASPAGTEAPELWGAAQVGGQWNGPIGPAFEEIQTEEAFSFEEYQDRSSGQDYPELIN
ncbi:uncharacterized protein I303_103022 [Kwoniella dejecticola CBS 10117]